MSLIDLLGKTLGGGGIQEIGRQLGSDEGTTSKAVGAALPLLLGALTGNAKRQDGAASLLGALTKDHDGSVLDDPSAVLRRPEAGPGAGILRHVLGGKQAGIESRLGQATGMDKAATGKLLTMLAPLVMGALGRQQREQKLDTRGVAGLLENESRQLREREPQAMGMLGGLLDADGDGDVDMGDIAKKGLGVLGKLFG